MTRRKINREKSGKQAARIASHALREVLFSPRGFPKRKRKK
jgi:hypothetical protein